MRAGGRGFTLVEVLIALAITAVVAAVALRSLTTVLEALETTRATSERTYAIDRMWMILGRDLRSFSPRPVRDEFGGEEPAFSGGPLARFSLSLTRAGWFVTGAQPRSELQRVNYLLQDDTLWREYYPVLDRAGDTLPRRVALLEGVETLDLRFLPAGRTPQLSNDGTRIDTRDWPQNWVPETGQAGSVLAPPVALEIRLVLEDWGELRRLYELPRG